MTKAPAAAPIARFGLADALGIVAVLAALAYFPGMADPLTYPKLMFLAGGGLLLAPWVITRWQAQGRPGWAVWVVCGSIVGILVWGLVSAIASGAPWPVSLFGWWGRGDGWLAWVGAAVLLLGAATLSTREAARTVTWLMGGGTIAALVGLIQFLGVSFPEGAAEGQVTSLMGNTNFASGYFAMIGVLALGRAVTQAALWQRIWGGVLFVILAFLAWETDSQQGPAALAAGVIIGGAAYAWLYRGKFRLYGLVAAGVVLILSAALLVASFFAVGPLARLWSERTFDIRQEYWASAINIMNGLPIFGTGPDGFARYVAEFRPESYVELLGPVLRVSAAHNIALQFGAVIGWPGLILWILAFGGASVFLLVRILRAPVASIGFTVAALGALVAYVIQGMVSIDMLPILTTGWIVAGLAVAAAREPKPIEPEPEDDQPKTRRQKVEAAVKAKNVKAEATPVAALGIGAVLGLAGAILVGVQMGAANAVQSVNSQEAALDFISNPLTPCPLRVNVTQQVIQQLPAEVSVPATYGATELDPRCAPMINFQSDVAVQQQDQSVAGPSTLDGVTFDPLLDYAWLLRSRYFLQAEDLDSAEAAADEAERVMALYPEGAGDLAALKALRADIETGRG